MTDCLYCFETDRAFGSPPNIGIERGESPSEDQGAGERGPPSPLTVEKRRAYIRGAQFFPAPYYELLRYRCVVDGVLTHMHADLFARYVQQLYAYRIFDDDESLATALAAAVVYLQRLDAAIIRLPWTHASPLAGFGPFSRMVAAVMLADKVMHDVPWNNHSFAQLGGIPVALLNQLEIAILMLVNWRVNLATDELDEILNPQ